MPCITDEPNRNQVATRRAAKLLAYVNETVGRDTPHWVTDLADNVYAVDERVIPMLCETLREMDPSVRDGIVYNPRNRTARDLASWWEDHQEADRKREEAEKGHAFQSVPSLEAAARTWAENIAAWFGIKVAVVLEAKGYRYQAEADGREFTPTMQRPPNER